MSAIETQVSLAEQLRVQATESLTNANTLRKMSLLGSEESYQLSTARTDVIDRENEVSTEVLQTSLIIIQVITTTQG